PDLRRVVAGARKARRTTRWPLKSRDKRSARKKEGLFLVVPTGPRALTLVCRAPTFCNAALNHPEEGGARPHGPAGPASAATPSPSSRPRLVCAVPSTQDCATPFFTAAGRRRSCRR